MKNKITTFLLLLILTLGVLFQTQVAHAATPLDKIHNYDITVDLRQDGSLDMYYKLKWEVLDSDSEGPLEWVKIGIPNKHIDEITAHTSNIKKIQYYSEGSKTYVRIDFDRAYYTNEIIDFEFSFHQSYMYFIDKDTNKVTYNFTPGWFDEIEVKSLIIRWNSEKAIDSSSISTGQGYYVWEKSLAEGERYTTNVTYDVNSYQFNTENQASDDSGGNSGVVIFIVVLVIIAIIVVVVIADSDDYDSGSGFGGGRTRYRSTYIHTSSRSSTRSSCACVSSCACACACASGGGRAGCSLKDFYKTKLKTDDIKKIIDNKK